MDDDYLATLVFLNMLVVKHAHACNMCDDEFQSSRHLTLIKEYKRIIYMLEIDDLIER